jgi:hypothetical protein
MLGLPLAVDMQLRADEMLQRCGPLLKTVCGRRDAVPAQPANQHQRYVATTGNRYLSCYLLGDHVPYSLRVSLWYHNSVLCSVPSPLTAVLHVSVMPCTHSGAASAFMQACRSPARSAVSDLSGNKRPPRTAAANKRSALAFDDDAASDGGFDDAFDDGFDIVARPRAGYGTGSASTSL